MEYDIWEIMKLGGIWETRQIWQILLFQNYGCFGNVLICRDVVVKFWGFVVLGNCECLG